MAKKQHWMDEVKDSLRQRVKDAIPDVALAVKGDRPYGYQPPKPDEEIKTFLNLDSQQRSQLFATMGPDVYQKWSSSMAAKLNHKFGPAAQALMPLLQGMPLESIAQGTGLDTNGSMGVAAAQADLTDMLGFDPFAN